MYASGAHPSVPKPTATTRTAQFAVGIALAALASLACACVAWGLVSALARPLDYPEGCILFNAQRIRDGLPLYVDAAVGAHEYGEPPARYFVAYTPIAATWLAALPSTHALAIARVADLSAWVFSLSRIVHASRAGCRLLTTCAALFVASTFVLTLWASSAKPDTVALLLASLALARALDRGYADRGSGILFALGALVKPSVIGMAFGALGATLIFGRGANRWRGVVAAGAVVAGGLAGFEIVSGGVALSHMRAALGLAFDGGLLLHSAASRAPLVAGLVALAVTAVRASPTRSASFYLALSVIASTVVTACIGLGKIGSASNYIMEPAIASVVALSRFPLALPRTRRRRWAWALIGGLTFAWSSTATVRSLSEEPWFYRARRTALESIRTRCLDRPGAFVASTDPGIEMEINGRIHTHDLELWNQTRLGRFSGALWASDLEHPNVRCFVTWAGSAPPPAIPEGLFPEQVAHVVREQYALEDVEAGYALYRRRIPSL